ncbi:inhibitor of apoptosis protein-like [Haliotis asinina]|uniref:inhibitor of apoptosis protein-like n=1 Tax=Haliotis asinina TaxID=109174 RepID=UPI003531B215
MDVCGPFENFDVEPDCAGITGHSPNGEKYSDRLRSFNSWPVQMKQSPKAMAEAGFIYTGKSDKVYCFKCKLRASRWTPEDDPLSEHLRLSPHCGYINMYNISKPMILLTRENYQRLVSKQEEQTAQQTAHQTAQPQKANETDDDTSHLMTYSAPPADNPVCNKKAEALFQVSDQLIKDISSTKTIGKLVAMWLFVKKNILKGQLHVDESLQLVVEKGKVLKGSNIVDLVQFFILSPQSHSPNGEKYSDRLRSFNSWPVQMKQSPKAMAEAGFIYTGKSDKVYCFKCKLRASRWTPEDDPSV